jgi:cation:H+ antiporter
MIGMALGILSVYFIISICIVLLGALLFVKSASAIAVRLGVPKFLVGAIVMSLATTSPELVVSYVAVMHKQVGIAVGNIFGSYIANIGLVLGFAGLLRPIEVSYTILSRQIPFCVAALTLLVIFSTKSYLYWIDGFVMILMTIPWLIWMIMNAKDHTSESDLSNEQESFVMSLLKLCSGSVCLFLGANVLVQAAEAIAFKLGMSSFLVGATLVAVSTSIPELFAGFFSVYMGEFELLMGNIIGANILLLLLVFPVTVMTSSSPVVLTNIWAEYLFMAILSMLLWLFSTYFEDNSRISRLESAILLLTFLVYQFVVLG